MQNVIEKEITITGKTLPPEGFRLHETEVSVDREAIEAVLKGELAAYRIRQFIPEDVCQHIVKNFWQSPDRTPRVGYGVDGVEGYFIGASHIEVTTDEYLQQAKRYENAVTSLYENTMDPVDAFRSHLAIACDGSPVMVRPAEKDGLKASHSKAVFWNNDGNFLLEPHDDLAQLRDPRQAGFEIQQATQVFAANFYPQVPEGSGQLKLWNIEPDDASREKLGLTYSGFPYPAELLEAFPSLVVPVKTGDVCVINGNLIHGVMQGRSDSVEQGRLLLAFFMTQTKNNELIWWT